MVISIHQPNFIPWYPFFQKMKKSDIFVANIRKNVFELMNESNQLIDLHGHERQDYLVHVFALMIEEYEEINTFKYHC